MVIVVDFDGTVVDASHAKADLQTPLVLLKGAKEALLQLKALGHLLILSSARANRAMLYAPDLDPLVRVGKRKVDLVAWKKAYPTNWARYRQMVVFVIEVLPGIFDAIDDGQAGKLEADAFIDNKALRLGQGVGALGWSSIVQQIKRGNPLNGGQRG